MNKVQSSEWNSRWLALVFSCLFYVALAALALFWTKTRPVEPLAFSSAPVNLSFDQIELQAAEPPPEVVPEPEPEPVPEEIIPEPVPQENVEPKPEEPPPEPKPVKVEAKVTQVASARTEPPVDKGRLLKWVYEQIEKEKYYPQSARNAGHEGQFKLRVTIGVDGKISEAVVLGGRGHMLLRRSLDKILAGLPGRDFGRTLDKPAELEFVFEFKLE